MKHGIILGDFHCGSHAGLTPPAWQQRDTPSSVLKHNKFVRLQVALWNKFRELLAAGPRLDFVLFTGDAIEGKSSRSGGVELVTANREEQVAMAVAVFSEVKRHAVPKVPIVGVYGCLTAGHRVLTADLRWVNVETLRPGNKLIAFDENPREDTGFRNFAEAIVLGNTPVIKKTYRMGLSDGTEIEASYDHRFLIKHQGKFGWVPMEELAGYKKRCKNKGKDWSRKFTRFMVPWEEKTSYEAGYLAFLGSFRPPRLFDKFTIDKLGTVRTRNQEVTYIENIECIGDREVWGLGTSTKTYIAEGFLCHNTDYHTGSEGEDWENSLADQVGFRKIGAHEWVRIEDVVIDIKHHVGSSAVPYGRGTPISREATWSHLWAERGLTPRAQVIVRGHAHYFLATMDSQRTALIAPALQGMGSRFGSRRCSGTVDWGFVRATVNGSQFDFSAAIVENLIEQQAKSVRI